MPRSRRVHAADAPCQKDHAAGGRASTTANAATTRRRDMAERGHSRSMGWVLQEGSSESSRASSPATHPAPTPERGAILCRWRMRSRALFDPTATGGPSNTMAKRARGTTPTRPARPAPARELVGPPAASPYPLGSPTATPRPATLTPGGGGARRRARGPDPRRRTRGRGGGPPPGPRATRHADVRSRSVPARSRCAPPRSTPTSAATSGGSR